MPQTLAGHPKSALQLTLSHVVPKKRAQYHMGFCTREYPSASTDLPNILGAGDLATGMRLENRHGDETRLRDSPRGFDPISDTLSF